jgi:hypothetical protein
MKETYRYKSDTFIFGDFILGIILSCLAVCASWRVIHAGQIYAGLFLIILSALPIYILIQSSRWKLQYKRNDKNKLVIVDNEARSLTVIDEVLGTEKTVTSRDIDNIELYYSSSLNAMVRNLGYSKINLKNASSIVLTQQTIGPWEIKELFSDKVTQTKKSTMNKLPKAYFHNNAP